MQCAVCSVQCTMYSVQYAVCSLHLLVDTLFTAHVIDIDIRRTNSHLYADQQTHWSKKGGHDWWFMAGFVFFSGHEEWTYKYHLGGSQKGY